MLWIYLSDNRFDFSWEFSQLQVSKSYTIVVPCVSEATNLGKGEGAAFCPFLFLLDLLFSTYCGLLAIVKAYLFQDCLHFKTDKLMDTIGLAYKCVWESNDILTAFIGMAVF